MTRKLQRPTEAFVALAWVVCTADKLGSVEERDFLYEKVRNMEIFKGVDRIEFQYLLGATFIQEFQTDHGDGSSLKEQGVDSLIQAVNAVLSPKLRVEAFRMAIELARVDGQCDAEEALLEQLRCGLEIDDKVAQDMLVQL